MTSLHWHTGTPVTSVGIVSKLANPADKRASSLLLASITPCVGAPLFEELQSRAFILQVCNGGNGCNGCNVRSVRNGCAGCAGCARCDGCTKYAVRHPDVWSVKREWHV